MKVQIIGLGNVGKSLVELIMNRQDKLDSMGLDLRIVSVSDSRGTAIDEDGLNLDDILKYKQLGWKGFKKYIKEYTSLNAIENISSDVVVELTPSTSTGEPGLSNIKAALKSGKNVVTANKGPLVVAYKKLKRSAEDNRVQLLYEATVAAHVPIFCLINSCFIADDILKIEGILNATTNFIIGEMEKGRSFEEALNEAIRAGWAETEYSDDVDGIDAARKVVITANVLFGKDAKLKDVKVQGIRNIESLIKEALKSNKKVKLVCEIIKNADKIHMSVAPRQISADDPLATVSQDKMGVKFVFKTSQEVFVSAQFKGPTQTAYAVLNDIIKTWNPNKCCCNSK